MLLNYIRNFQLENIGTRYTPRRFTFPPTELPVYSFRAESTQKRPFWR